MSALHDMGNAISRALVECPASEVLSVITGVFVGLTIGAVKESGSDPDKEIKIDGGSERDITIHAKKGISA